MEYCSGKVLHPQSHGYLKEFEDGELYLNNIPFSNYQRESLYTHLGVSFPINQIFEGTIRENVLMGRTVSEQELAETLSLLKLDDYLVHQPNGVDSFVDSGGRRLPRSIIQKLLIARIIIAKPGLLLLEDPLQFIPEDEKRRIIDYIMDTKRDWTVLVISDFGYWTEKSDRLININNK